jgi:serine protease Do
MRRMVMTIVLPGLWLAVSTLVFSRDDHRDRETRLRAFKFDRQFSREEPHIRETFRPVVAAAARSTVRLRVDGRVVAFGVAVHGDGYIVTKASELDDGKSLQIEVEGGLKLPARLLDRLPAYDLALLKIEATGLDPIEWSDKPAPAPGTFLAAPSPGGEPVAIGVASVGPRNLYEPPQGFLGVRLKPNQAVIDRIYQGGAAEKAGLEKDDELIAIDGTPVKTADDLIGEVSRHRPGEEIMVRFRRVGEEREVPATLIDRREFLSQFIRGHDPMELMHGRLSNHRNGFFSVFQHDLVLEPEECGGPLVDLDGHVVGLDIARAGRVESLAIPAEDMRMLLSKVTNGKFALPDIGELREALKKADLALARAQETRALAERALERANRLLETLPPATKTEMPVTQEPPVRP